MRYPEPSSYEFKGFTSYKMSRNSAPKIQKPKKELHEDKRFLKNDAQSVYFDETFRNADKNKRSSEKHREKSRNLSKTTALESGRS